MLVMLTVVSEMPDSSTVPDKKQHASGPQRQVRAVKEVGEAAQRRYGPLGEITHAGHRQPPLTCDGPRQLEPEGVLDTPCDQCSRRRRKQRSADGDDDLRGRLGRRMHERVNAECGGRDVQHAKQGVHEQTYHGEEGGGCRVDGLGIMLEKGSYDLCLNIRTELSGGFMKTWLPL